MNGVRAGSVRQSQGLKVAVIAVAALLLAITCVVLAPSQANAETKTVSGNYAVLEGTTLTFKYASSAASVTADAVYTGYDTAGYDFNDHAPWYSYDSGITQVVFDGSVKGNLRPVSTATWFYSMTKLETIDGLGNLDTSCVTNMQNMFMYCSSLSSLDVSSFNTSQVMTMYNMFFGCSSLTSLDVSGFDTSKVKHMGFMFYGCKNLATLDISRLDTSQVTAMLGMFEGCSSLTSLDVSSLNTSQVVTMNSMFSGCSSLKNLDVSGFDTSKVKYMGYMFYGCSSLTTLDVSGFDVSHLVDSGEDAWGVNSMFKNCSSLRTIRGLGSWSAEIESLEYKNMFEGCTSLVGGNGTAYDASHVDIEYARVDVPGSPGYFTGSVSMYRLYNPNSGEHFYTADESERSLLISIGWNNEGVGWTAPSDGTPVYRLYNANGGEHHYTTDAAEKDMLVGAGWSYEGVGWYSAPDSGVPLFRDYNPNAFSNNHNYTASSSEHEHLVFLGWRDEGIGWYGV